MTVNNILTTTSIINVMTQSLPDGVTGSPLITNLIGNPQLSAIGGTDLYFLHTQASALSTWTVNHNTGAYPNVEVYTAGGQKILAEILHVSLNQSQVLFDSPMAGFAVCS